MVFDTPSAPDRSLIHSNTGKRTGAWLSVGSPLSESTAPVPLEQAGNTGFTHDANTPGR